MDTGGGDDGEQEDDAGGGPGLMPDIGSQTREVDEGAVEELTDKRRMELRRKYWANQVRPLSDLSGYFSGGPNNCCSGVGEQLGNSGLILDLFRKVFGVTLEFCMHVGFPPK